MKQVVKNCETIFTAEDVLQKTDVLDPILAQNILDIVKMEVNPDNLEPQSVDKTQPSSKSVS